MALYIIRRMITLILTMLLVSIVVFARRGDRARQRRPQYPRRLRDSRAGKVHGEPARP